VRVVQPHPVFRDQPFMFRAGAPERDILAHLISRTELMRLLVDDPQVTHLFRAVGDLARVASLLAQYADLVARECGWRGRGHMYAEPTLYPDPVQPVHRRAGLPRHSI
jgi:hypothetical protein